jgi:hypothetical protein
MKSLIILLIILGIIEVLDRYVASYEESKKDE